MKIQRRMYVTSVSGTSIVLSPEPFGPGASPVEGTALRTVTVTVAESTAAAAVWGTTGACGRFVVTFEKVS